MMNLLTIFFLAWILSVLIFICLRLAEIIELLKDINLQSERPQSCETSASDDQNNSSEDK